MPEKVNFDKDGNAVTCTNIGRVIPVAVLIRPSNFLHEQLRTIQKLAQAIDYFQKSISVPTYPPDMGQHR